MGQESPLGQEEDSAIQNEASGIAPSKTDDCVYAFLVIVEITL